MIKWVVTRGDAIRRMDVTEVVLWLFKRGKPYIYLTNDDLSKLPLPNKRVTSIKEWIELLEDGI